MPRCSKTSAWRVIEIMQYLIAAAIPIFPQQYKDRTLKFRRMKYLTSDCFRLSRPGPSLHLAYTGGEAAKCPNGQ